MTLCPDPSRSLFVTICISMTSYVLAWQAARQTGEKASSQKSKPGQCSTKQSHECFTNPLLKRRPVNIHTHTRMSIVTNHPWVCVQQHIGIRKYMPRKVFTAPVFDFTNASLSATVCVKNVYISMQYMRACVYACTSKCVYVGMCVPACMCVCVVMSMCACVYVRVWVYARICVCVAVGIIFCVYVYVVMCESVYAYMCMCVCVCMPWCM